MYTSTSIGTDFNYCFLQAASSNDISGEPFREVIGMMQLNGKTAAAFRYNVTDGTGLFGVVVDGAIILYDYNPNTGEKSSPRLVDSNIPLISKNRWTGNNGTPIPNWMVKTFKWNDIQAAFGNYADAAWNTFVNGGGKIYSMPDKVGVRNSNLYNISTYRFITNINRGNYNATFFIDVMDY